MKTICCPKCGEPLERGQYYYDLETDTIAPNAIAKVANPAKFTITNNL